MLACVRIEASNMGMGRFGAAVSARPIRRGRFGAETIRRRPIRRQDLSARAVSAPADSALGRFGAIFKNTGF